MLGYAVSLELSVCSDGGVKPTVLGFPFTAERRRLSRRLIRSLKASLFPRFETRWFPARGARLAVYTHVVASPALRHAPQGLERSHFSLTESQLQLKYCFYIHLNEGEEHIPHLTS